MITRKYIIEEMINNKEFGRVNIVNSSEDFKSKLWKIIEEAKVSIVTVAMFLNICENKIEKCKKENFDDIDLNKQMLDAKNFVEIVMGFDVNRVTEYFTKEDSDEGIACEKERK